MTDVTDKLIIQYESAGAKEFAQNANNAKKSLDDIVVVSDKVERSTGSIDNKFAALERRFGTTAGQAAQFEKIQKSVNDAVAANPTLQSRANEVIAAAEARYLSAGKATTALAEAHKGLDAQGQAALHSVRSLVEQVALGQSPVQALTGQLNHLTFAATGEGGISGAFKQVGSFVGNLVTPLRLVAGGLLGAGAAAAYFAVQWDNTQKEVDRALIGIGQRTGTTAGEINKFAKDNASVTGLSVAEARNAAIEFTKTGNIAVAGLHGVGEAVHGFATLTGTDATEATKKLSAVFSGDLAKGADELNKTYGFLDSATRKQVESLQLQGDRMGAVQVIIDKMAPANIKAAESVGVLTKAWTGFKNVISNVGNLPGQSDQDKLAGLQAQRAAAANTPSTIGSNPGGYGLLNTGALAGGKSAELAALDSQIYALQKKLDGLKTDGAQAQLRAMSTAGDDVVKSVIPQIEQIDKLELALKTLQAAQNTPGVSRSLGADDAAVTAIQNQLQALKESQAEAARYNIEIANISSSWGNVGQSVALQLQAMQNALPVAQQWTEAGRMKAQQEATFLDLLNKGKTAEEAGALAAAQYDASKASAVANAQKLVQSSQDNLESIRAQGTGMEAVVASTIAYRDAMQAGATATQAAAIAANTLAAATARAAQSAAQSEQAAYNKANGFDSNGNLTADSINAFQAANKSSWAGKDYTFQPDPNHPIFYRGGGGPRMDFGAQATAVQNILKAQSAPDAVLSTAYNSGGADAAIAAIAAGKVSGDYTSSLDAFIGLKNSGTTDKNVQAANLQYEMELISKLPANVQRDQKLADLQNSIDQLTKSTDSLNSTNQDLLSPYYSQDPRTSHIGFRSQGMATTGYIDIPGVPSANDNMTLTLPVASGERVNVSNGPNRGGGSSAQPISIVNHITIAGNANKDEVGRTFYQITQTQAKQIAASQR
jgi:hypothetical protein